ncbi:MAG: DUF4197 domain-containing protein [Gammaproteobacteria bacterium]|nr:DUF4197 domain-containing protein [Gammaproteobacteria bacterium]
MQNSIKAINHEHTDFRVKQRRMTTIAVVCVIAGVTALTFSLRSEAGWADFLDKYISSDDKKSGDISLSNLTDGEMVDGLKEALSVGVQRAISLLGKEGGFLNDAAVRIPMPSALKSVEKGLRAVKQDKYADQFIGTMNSAAEKAIPLAGDIFAKAIKNMSLEDAKSILSGPENAATAFFRKNTESQLSAAIFPLVQNATNETGVTSSYKNLTKKAGMLGGLIKKDDLDLDKHVTDKALDGLFAKLALEEAKIRQDPLARSSDLLRKVFSSL